MNKTTVEVTVFQLAVNDLEARKAAMETTVYQSDDIKRILNNFIDVSKMENIGTLITSHSPMDTDTDILDSIYINMNKAKLQYMLPLNYSLSVGDVLRIEDKHYRILPKGYYHI